MRELVERREADAEGAQRPARRGAVEAVRGRRRSVEPALRAAGVTVVASYVTETSPNNFPQLPVREQVRVFALFAAFADPADYERSREALAGSAAWRAIEARFQRQLAGPPEILRLQATPRSELRPDGETWETNWIMSFTRRPS